MHAVRIQFALCSCLGIATLSGCAVRTAGSYRLIVRNNHQTLMPPGVARPDITRRTITADVPRGPDPCPASAAVTIRVKRDRLRVTVTQTTLAGRPAGWLRDWTEELEAKGCITRGTGSALAQEVIDSVPLDPAVAFRLLHANLVDLAAGTRIQVTSPVVRENTPPDAPLYESVPTSGDGNDGTLTLKASPNLLGRETDLYAVHPRRDGPGVTVSVVSAERTIEDRTEQIAGPATNLFRFPEAAAFYRLFYKGSESGFTALIVAAATYQELERLMATLEGGIASCERIGAEWCQAIPKLIAFNIVLPAEVNGKAVDVRYGATVGEVIRFTGERHPQGVVAGLSVYRMNRGRKVAVQFDKASPAILELPILGGEVISWK